MEKTLSETYLMKKPKEKNKISKITIYKLENSFNSSTALREYKESKGGNYKGWNYQIFLRQKQNILPSWEPLIKDFVSESDIPQNAYASMVMLFQKDKHLFSLTAGYGYADVREFAVRDFGIDTACKCLNPNELNNLYQKMPTGNVYGWSRSLRGKYMPSNDPINKRSVLKALKGKVIDKTLGVTMEGRTSLAISGKKNFSDVVNLIDKLIEIEKSSEYTVKIKGLDEVSKELKQELEEELVSKISNGDFDDYLFGYDDDLVFNNCENLSVGDDRNKYSIDDTQEAFASAKRQNSTNPAGIKVVGYDDQDQEIFKKMLIDLIEGELDYKSEKYFRIDKKWYKTNANYRKEIEKEFNEIEKIDSRYFKAWPRKNGKFITEEEFLNQNIDADRILAHTQKISQIEFADIIDKTKKYLIHVKKGKGAYLRNLFAQGYVSGDMFKGDEFFRAETKNKFGIDLNSRYSIIFAVFSEDGTDIDSVFTLFAKVDLVERCRALKEIGFDVQYCLINQA